MYVDVLIKNSLGNVFTYELPEEAAENGEKLNTVLGRYVEVPVRNKICLGIVINEREKDYTPDFKTKKLVLLDDGRIVDKTSFLLAEEISKHAFCPFAEALELFMYALPKSNRKLKEEKSPKPSTNQLSEEQLEAADRIYHSDKREHLLYGVTGSGKTEVYFELIRRALEAGKRALYLVPEISITPQMTSRIKRAFSDKKVAVIHSKITEARRARFMQEIAAGKVDIVLGARSAILTPLREIGVVIVDECHETSYSQEKRPRYDAIRLAKKLAEIEDAKLVMGSATPDVSTYYQYSAADALVSLENRYSNFELPKPLIVDMRYESDKLISSQLHHSIMDRLDKGEQSILFINRKGYSSVVQCMTCGSVCRCPNCDISKTYYKGIHKIICNYCAHSEVVPQNCDACGSDKFNFSGIGTERIEAEIKERYPEARVARVDRSVITSGTRLKKITDAFEKGEIDILVGTQMIAKGLDFPGVTLVGILSADLQLYLPSYLSSERAFQLFTQVSGRAGRSGLRSEVILQTYSPTHMAVASDGYYDFYKKEIKFRKKLGYPPYKELMMLTLSDTNERKAYESAFRVKNYLKRKIELENLQNNVKIFDEVHASLKRLDSHYRYQVFVVMDNEVFDRVSEIVGVLEHKLKNTTKSLIVVDIGAKS